MWATRHQILVLLHALLDAHLQEELKLRIDQIRVVTRASSDLLAELNVFRENVIPLGTMPWELIVAVPLVDVGPSQYQVLNHLEMASVSCQMQSCPLLDATCHI